MVLYGHYRGALKQCVSLGALILTIVLVKIATPYMTDFIKDNPSIRQRPYWMQLAGRNHPRKTRSFRQRSALPLRT